MQYSNLSAHILALHMKALESCYKQKLTHVFIAFNTNETLPLKILSKLFYCMFKNNKYVNAIPILEITYVFGIHTLTEFSVVHQYVKCTVLQSI